MSEEEEKKFPPNFPLEGPPDPLSLLRDMIQKIERAEKTIETTAKGLDAVGKLDADTLVEKGVPDPKELLFGGGKKAGTEAKTPDEISRLTKQSIRYMEKAIEDHDMMALQKAIENNPCGICRKTLKKIASEALSREDIINKLKGEAKVIKRASRIYQVQQEMGITNPTEEEMEKIKKKVREKYGYGGR